MKTECLDNVNAWYVFLKENWLTLRQLAQDAYSQLDRGAFLIDVGTPPSLRVELAKQIKYVNETLAKQAWDSWSLSKFLHQIDSYNPCRSILVYLWDGTDAQPLLLIEHEDGTLRESANSPFWINRERSCPRCNTSFRSVQDRGACPQCGHIFYASDVYGADNDHRRTPIPPIVDLRPDWTTPENFEQLHRMRTRIRSIAPATEQDEFDQLVTTIRDADYQIHNGGFEQFFYNVGQHTQGVIEAFEKLGATDNGRVILAACEVFPNHTPSEDAEELFEQIESVREYAEDRWNQLATEYCSLEVDLETMLFDYWIASKGSS